MRRITFYIGLGRVGTRGAQMQRGITLRKTLLDYFGGYSLLPVQGGWVGPNGPEEESSLVASVIYDSRQAFDLPRVKALAANFALLYDQQEVLVTVESLESADFVKKEDGA